MRADRETAGTRWSYCRDLGRTRLVVMDSRAGRVLDAATGRWSTTTSGAGSRENARGGHDHLLLATSLPWLARPRDALPGGVERGGVRRRLGRLATRLGEKVRQGLDLEHWAAFHDSFNGLDELVREVGAGEHGDAPATIVALSGDVHHSYLAEVAYPPRPRARSAVYQAVCSPVRNPLDSRETRTIKAAMSRPAHVVAPALARSAGVRDPSVRWRIERGPWFDNAAVHAGHRGPPPATCASRRRCPRTSSSRQEDERRLETVLERRLALGPAHAARRPSRSTASCSWSSGAVSEMRKKPSPLGP